MENFLKEKERKKNNISKGPTEFDGRKVLKWEVRCLGFGFRPSGSNGFSLEPPFCSGVHTACREKKRAAVGRDAHAGRK